MLERAHNTRVSEATSTEEVPYTDAFRFDIREFIVEIDYATRKFETEEPSHVLCRL